jgi:hypothetical protein
VGVGGSEPVKLAPMPLDAAHRMRHGATPYSFWSSRRLGGSDQLQGARAY